MAPYIAIFFIKFNNNNHMEEKIPLIHKEGSIK